jgi:hypothetical protein
MEDPRKRRVAHRDVEENWQNLLFEKSCIKSEREKHG